MTSTPENITKAANCMKYNGDGISRGYATAILQYWWARTGKVPVLIHLKGGAYGTAVFDTKTRVAPR